MNATIILQKPDLLPKGSSLNVKTDEKAEQKGAFGAILGQAANQEDSQMENKDGDTKEKEEQIPLQALQAQAAYWMMPPKQISLPIGSFESEKMMKAIGETSPVTVQDGLMETLPDGAVKEAEALVFNDLLKNATGSSDVEAKNKLLSQVVVEQGHVMAENEVQQADPQTEVKLVDVNQADLKQVRVKQTEVKLVDVNQADVKLPDAEQVEVLKDKSMFSTTAPQEQTVGRFEGKAVFIDMPKVDVSTDDTGGGKAAGKSEVMSGEKRITIPLNELVEEMTVADTGENAKLRNYLEQQNLLLRQQTESQAIDGSVKAGGNEDVTVAVLPENDVNLLQAVAEQLKTVKGERSDKPANVALKTIQNSTTERSDEERTSLQFDESVKFEKRQIQGLFETKNTKISADVDTEVLADGAQENVFSEGNRPLISESVLWKAAQERSEQVQTSQRMERPMTSLQDRYNVVSQLLEKARLIQGHQESEVRIRLNPQHLGEVDLRVRVENGAVSASFHTNNPEVKALIESSLAQLKQELSNQGLKVDNVGVQAGLGDLFSNQQQGGYQQQEKAPKTQQQMLMEQGELNFTELVEQEKDGWENKTKTDGVDYRI